MKYKFEQFKTQIVDPAITIDYSNVSINNLTKEISSVNIILETPNGSKFGITLNDISIGIETWDSCDLEALVAIELEDYRVD